MSFAVHTVLNFEIMRRVSLIFNKFSYSDYKSDKDEATKERSKVFEN